MMREIRALIVDDEPLARRGIRQLLTRHPDVIVVGESRDGREALRALETLTPDLVFLDVQMPELDGFGVVRERGPERMPAIIFVTAYNEFAVRAFEAHALDYLVKPVNEARFESALQRVRERRSLLDAQALTVRLTALLNSDDARARVADEAAQRPGTVPVRRLVVPTSVGDIVLGVDEVDWIQAEDYYAAIHVRGKRHLIRESLASLADRLDTRQFMRVHRSAVVNIDRVRELRAMGQGESVLVLRDGTRVPVSRRRRSAVAELLRRSVR
jgi:two-component system LytT family response regulator